MQTGGLFHLQAYGLRNTYTPVASTSGITSAAVPAASAVALVMPEPELPWPRCQ
jgi:hypothetical protein